MNFYFFNTIHEKNQTNFCFDQLFLCKYILNDFPVKIFFDVFMKSWFCKTLQKTYFIITKSRQLCVRYNSLYIYRVIHRSVDKLKLNYPTYYKGKRNKFLIDRMEI